MNFSTDGAKLKRICKKDCIRSHLSHGVAVTQIPVKFSFYPADPTSKQRIAKDGKYSYEKESDGKKKMFLAGISSGSQIDAHGDFLTKEAIEDLHKQAQEKDIPLYANHDRTFTDDIGVLRVSEVLENGDWYTEYELHPDDPEAIKAWKQANGIDPYSRKREFGFSIEGFIPESAIRKTALGREISKVEIDPGVSLVTKPAYTVSHVSAIHKALGAHAKKSLKDMLKLKENTHEIHETKWDIECAFQELCALILNSSQSPEEKSQSLNEAFDQYKTEIVPVLLSLPTTEQVESVAVAKSKRVALAKQAIEILGVIKTAKGVKMNEDMKSVLGEVIASLQMLLQSGENTEPAEAAMKEAIAKAQTVLKKAENDGNPKDVPAETKNQVNELMKSMTEIAKAVAARKEEPAKDETAEELKKALAAMKSRVRKAEGDKEKTEAETEAQKAMDEMEKAQTEEEVSAAKEKLTKAAERLAKAEATGSSDAEEIIEGVLPDGDESAESIAKSLSAKNGSVAMAKMIGVLASELAVQKKAMNEIIAGFSEPVKKGLNSQLGSEPLVERLAKMLGERDTQEPSGYLGQFGESSIQKSKYAIAADFMRARKAMK